MALLPSGHRPIEPFVGSGAVFSTLITSHASWLADSDEDLINLYLALQREG